MNIAFGSDHGGFELKEVLKNYAKELGYEVSDFGTYSEDSVDYPEYAIKVAESVANKEYDRGIVVCGTGIGASIAANKVKGIRCALTHDLFSAEATRAHNNSNVLALGGRVVEQGLAKEIVKVWLETEFEGGRHLNRINLIKDYETKK
jgi:ribose 5-phosphate isomerase B